jgi:hypothetical protein
MGALTGSDYRKNVREQGRCARQHRITAEPIAGERDKCARVEYLNASAMILCVGAGFACEQRAHTAAAGGALAIRLRGDNALRER